MGIVEGVFIMAAFACAFAALMVFLTALLIEITEPKPHRGGRR
jgi:hypothetical protein